MTPDRFARDLAAALAASLPEGFTATADGDAVTIETPAGDGVTTALDFEPDDEGDLDVYADAAESVLSLAQDVVCEALDATWPGPPGAAAICPFRARASTATSCGCGTATKMRRCCGWPTSASRSRRPGGCSLPRRRFRHVGVDGVVEVAVHDLGPKPTRCDGSGLWLFAAELSQCATVSIRLPFGAAIGVFST